MFININFFGGLGNQLFQYAAVRGLNEKCLLFFNTDGYKNDHLNRQFGLRYFQVKGKIINDKKYILKLFTPKTKLNQLIYKIGLFADIKEQGFFVHESKQLETKLLSSITGFWQSELYFKHIRKQLLTELIPSALPPYPNFIQNSSTTVAVHVRRTDYLEDSRYGFLGELYYRRAIELCKSKIESPTFIFFSDDINWCKKTFSRDDSIIFFENESAWEKDYLQLYLMAQCNHQIIANSSFSWWSGWLNKNENKLVVRPEKPFNDTTILYESYYPESWIAL